MRSYFWNLFIAADQAVNTILGGYPDETISSRLAKGKRLNKWWGRFGCWCLNIADPGHCGKTIECDEGEPCNEGLQTVQSNQLDSLKEALREFVRDISPLLKE